MSYEDTLCPKEKRFEERKRTEKQKRKKVDGKSQKRSKKKERFLKKLFSFCLFRDKIEVSTTKGTNMTNTKACCFTGHRAFYDNTKELSDILSVLLDNMITQGYTVFRAGGALGFDMLAAETILRKKEDGRNIRLELLLPCPEQDENWNAANKARYRRILSLADSKEYIADHYTPSCMHERNRRLVDGSSLCIAYLKHAKGGTAYTCRYAEKLGVKIINLATYLSAKSKN